MTKLRNAWLTIVTFLVVFIVIGVLASEISSELGQDSNDIIFTEEEIVQRQCQHEYSDWTITKESSCEEEGEKTRTCPKCNHIDIQTIRASHTEVQLSSEPATCTATGLTQGSYCSVCGKTIVSQQTLPMLPHNIVTYAGKAATCTENGWMQYEACTDCDYSTKEEIIAFGSHDWLEGMVDATCGEAGYYYRDCINCNAYEELDTIPPTGDHTWDSENSEILKYATCTEDGEARSYCSVCETEIYKVLSSPGHDWDDATCTTPKTCIVCEVTEGNALGHSYNSVVTEPTCTAQGYTTHTCSRCRNSYKDTYTDALGHTWQDATCTTAKTCTVCNATEGKALGHTEVIDAAVSATCITDGLTEGKHCSVCNTVLVAQTVISATGHTEVIDAAVSATCTRDGLTEGSHCSVCNAIIKAQTVIAATGHVGLTAEGLGLCSNNCGYKRGWFLANGLTPSVNIGDKIIIVSSEYNYALSTTQKTNNRGQAEITKIDNMVTFASDAGVQVIVLDYSEEYGKFVFNVDGRYLYAAGANSSNYLKTQSSINANAVWDVYIDLDGIATIKAFNGKKNNQLMYNATSDIFSCYAGTQKTVSIYIYIESEAHICNYVETVIEATCGYDGYTLHTCSICHDSYASNVITSIGQHNYVSVVTNATCIEQGYTTHTCSNCNDSYKDTYTEALGHDWGEYYIVDTGSCVTEYKERHDCNNCNEYEIISSGPQLNVHNYSSTIETVEATCNKGKYDKMTCVDCGHVKEIMLSDALGHDYATVVTEPTCEAQGYTTFTCKRCSYSYKDYTEALGHNYETVVTEPTCTAQGYTTHTCSRCRDSYKDTYTDALGHTWQDATCTTPKTCTVCNATEGKALGHTEVIDAGRSSTCILPGITEGSHCSVCNTVIKEQELLPLAEHNYVAVVTKPTCETGGYTTNTCSGCGGSYKDAFIVPLGHTEVTDASVAPTCTETGLTEGSHCSVCNVVLMAQEVIPATGHKYEAVVTDSTCFTQGYTTHTCSVCGDTYKDNYTAVLEHVVSSEWTVLEEPTLNTNGIKVKKCELCGDVLEWGEVPALLTYTSNGANSYMVSKGDTELTGVLEIPSHYMGVPVTEIGDFSGCTNITRVIIPDSVTRIGYMAFADCTSMTSVEIPNSVTFIGPYAFSNTLLYEVYIPSSVTTMGDNVFRDCSSLHSDENRTAIYCGAFSKPDGWNEDWAGGAAHIEWGASPL